MQDIVDFVAYLRSLDVQLSAKDGQLHCNAPKGVIVAELKEQLKEKKYSLIAFLEDAAKSTPVVPITRINRDGYLPPSFGQERLWFLGLIEGPSAAYNIAGGMRLSGPLNTRALENAVKEIIRRHEVLRTSIVTADGRPKIIIRSEVDWKLQVRSLRDLPEAERAQALADFASEELRLPFDFSQPPLIRVYLVELGENDHALLLNVHHIAADGWSLGVFSEELTHLYRAFCKGEPSPLPELSIQYVDYARWHREYVESGVRQNQLPYWKQQLRGPLPVMELPCDHPRPLVASFRGKRLRQVLPAELLASTQRFSLAANVTLFTTLLTAFKILLFRYTRQPDVIVGSAAAGRTRPELEKLIGLFINNLPLRTDLSGNPTVRELLARVQDTALNAFANQDVSFGDLVEATQIPRELNRSPLFQVMFILQNFAARVRELPDLTLTPLEFDTGASRFDLTVEAGEDAKRQLRLDWEYNSDLFDDATIDLMQRHFGTLLEGILLHPERRISEVEMFTESERKALAEAGEGAQAEFPRELCIHELVEQQALRNPEAVAVVFNGDPLSYKELNLRATRLSNRLRALGVGPDVLIAVCLERSAEIPVAILGVLKAGGAYVPIDPQYPRERIAFMLEDSGATALITETRLLDVLPQNTPTVLCVDRNRECEIDEGERPPSPSAKPENLAYVIYTSGSTGKPKGVEITHRSVVNFLTSMQREPAMREQDRLLAVTTLSFDIAGLEFYLPLTTGACVVIAPRETLADGVALARLMREANISVMQATPATWRLLLESGWSGMPGLKILCGGEALPRELANRLLLAGAEVWNLYGPTETTIWSTVYRVDSQPGAVPIGKPIANTQVYVLDEYGHALPIGVPGELYIGGDGLARGYLRRPELTAERFVPNPFRGEEKLYRTGDLARWRADGNLEYLARLDHQVKLRGFRIELGEIETALEQQANVRQAVVMIREDVPGDQRLTAYLVPADRAIADQRTLRDALMSRLPDYMIPAQFVFLDSFPLTPNRKVDRQRLPAPDQELSNSAAFAPPRTESEAEVAAIWQNLLNRSRVGVHDNFFDLGGHSLLVVQLQSRLRRKFGHEISLVELFQRPTVSAMASLLHAKNSEPTHTFAPALAPTNPS